MNAWEAIVAAGKRHPNWNGHPNAGLVTVLDGRPVQINGHAAKQVREGWRGYTVMFFRYLDDQQPTVGQMAAAKMTVACDREYRRLSCIG